MKRLLGALLLLAAPLAAQPDPVLSGARTDCGPRNGSWPINWSAPFQVGNVDSGRARYGPCYGGGPRCSDLGGACIETEAERQEAIKMLLALTAGRCDPPRGTMFPSDQTLHDWTLSVLGMEKLRKRYRDLGCKEEPPPQSAACPAGQECRGPCPACPPAPACGPIASGTSLPPTGQALLVWDARTAPPTMRRAVWLGNVYLLQSGAELAPEKVSHWMPEPRP